MEEGFGPAWGGLQALPNCGKVEVGTFVGAIFLRGNQEESHNLLETPKKRHTQIGFRLQLSVSPLHQSSGWDGNPAPSPKGLSPFATTTWLTFLVYYWALLGYSWAFVLCLVFFFFSDTPGCFCFAWGFSSGERSQ